MCDFYYGPERDSYVSPDKPAKGWRVGYTGKDFYGDKADGLEGPFRARGHEGQNGWLWAGNNTATTQAEGMREGFHGFCVFKRKEDAALYKRDLVRNGSIKGRFWSIVRVEFCGNVKQAAIHTRMGDRDVFLAQRIRRPRRRGK